MRVRLIAGTLVVSLSLFGFGFRLPVLAQLKPPPPAGDGMAARRNQAFAFLQGGQAEQALRELYAVPNPIGWDQFMKGRASEMLGLVAKAAQWYCAACDEDRQNDEYRTKAIDSLLLLPNCDGAIHQCLEGEKYTHDPKKQKFYENKIAEIKRYKENLAKGAENIARHKERHPEYFKPPSE